MPRRVVYAPGALLHPKGELDLAASGLGNGAGSEGGEGGGHVERFRGGAGRNFSQLFMDHHRRRLNFGGGRLLPLQC